MNGLLIMSYCGKLIIRGLITNILKSHQILVQTLHIILILNSSDVIDSERTIKNFVISKYLHSSSSIYVAL